MAAFGVYMKTIHKQPTSPLLCRHLVTWGRVEEGLMPKPVLVKPLKLKKRAGCPWLDNPFW